MGLREADEELWLLGKGRSRHLSAACPAGSILPVTVYDQHGFRVLFHFAKDALPERPDVLVVVISMLSTAPQPIRNIVFQSAVPKVRQAPGFRPPNPPRGIVPLQEGVGLGGEKGSVRWWEGHRVLSSLPR